MRSSRAEVVASGLDLPEGPAMLPDGSVAFVQQLRSTASCWRNGRVDTLACSPGAWNSLTLGASGELYAAQNGGVSLPYAATQRAPAGIQRLAQDGDVTWACREVAGAPVVMPNDLAFGPDGRLWFTDPAHVYGCPTPGARGRVCAVGGHGTEQTVEVGAAYCNGIAVSGSGRVLWVESYARRLCTLDDDGGRIVLAQLPEPHVPDGLALAVDGRVFIATVESHAIAVCDDAGRLDAVLPLDDRAMPTNLCFDGSALWVTDFGADCLDGPARGRLWRLDTDAVGAPLHVGSLSPPALPRPPEACLGAG